MVTPPGDGWQNGQSNWITHPEVDPQEVAELHFRRSFQLEEVPDSFVVSLTADNHYRLFVNGQWVGFGPQLGELADWRYDTYDLADYLRAGENLIAVQVNNWGHHRFFGLQSIHTAFALGGYGPAEVLNTTGNEDGWLVEIDRAWQVHPILWRVAEPDIVGGLYANNPTDILQSADYHWGWQEPDYPTEDWQSASFLEWLQTGTGGGFLWSVHPRNVAGQVLTNTRFKTVRRSSGLDIATEWLGGLPLELPAGQSFSLLLDMEEITAGYPEFHWSGGTNGQITATYAENLFLPDKSKTDRNRVEGTITKGYFDQLFLDGAEHHYTPSWLRVGRYLQLDIDTGDSPLTLYGPLWRRVTSRVPIQARWSCDDEQLNAVYDICTRTVEICTQDYFLSDAYYETMQYIGDTKVHGQAWQALTGDPAHMRNALLQFNQGRNEEGLLLSCYPLRTRFTHATYSLVWVDMLWDYLQWTGDEAFVSQFLASVDHTLSYFIRHLDEDTGLLGPIPYIHFVDWYPGGGGTAPGSDGSQSAVVSLHLAHALRSAASLYRELESEAPQGERYQDLAQEISTSVYTTCFSSERGLMAERPSQDYFDQHSNIMAVLMDAIPADQHGPTLERILRESDLAQATYYYRYYLFAALKKAGRNDLIPEAMAPWLDLVNLNCTGLVERFEYPTKKTRSEAHPWGASPILVFLGTYAGLQPAAGGVAQLDMQPQFGHLTEIKGRYPSLHGLVEFELELRRNGRVKGWLSSTADTIHFRYGEQEITVLPGQRLRIR